MHKTLITGATGGLGGEVAQLLKAKTGAENVAVLVRDGNSDKANQYRNEGFDVRVADYNDISGLTAAFTGIEVLYFVSGNDIHGRFDQHQNVITAAKATGVKHIFYTSTVRKDESPEAPLHLVVSAHALTEQWIKESGITYTFLRHNLYVEVIPMFIGNKAALLQSKTIFLPAEEAKVWFVSRTDLAEAEANMLADPESHANKIHELNGGRGYSFSQIAGILSEITKEEINYVSPEVPFFENTLADFGLSEEIIAESTMFNLAIANGEFDQQSSDLETILGRPTTSLEALLATIYQ